MAAFPPHKPDFFQEVKHDVCSVPGAPRVARFLLKAGIGLVFLLFGIDKFRTPQLWLGYLPQWLVDLAPVDKLTLLYGIGAIEAAIGAALLLGILVRPAAFLASVMLVGIILASGFTDVAIRDVGLLAGALALLFLGRPRRRR
jgi:uncharacterized membrane protein YphA (DoxX/SURF4 family)